MRGTDEFKAARAPLMSAWASVLQREGQAQMRCSFLYEALAGQGVSEDRQLQRMLMPKSLTGIPPSKHHVLWVEPNRLFSQVSAAYD